MKFVTYRKGDRKPLFKVEYYDGENVCFQMFNDLVEATDFYNECLESKKYETVYLSELLKQYNVWDKYLGQ